MKAVTRSVLQDWVTELGLRHQGVLLSACRGCDTAPKNDPSKDLVRAYRNYVLISFYEDARDSKGYIDVVSMQELTTRCLAFARNHDHYPIHYVTHFLHAAEILGYYYPDNVIKLIWHSFYFDMCRRLHLVGESKERMDMRLNEE